MRATLFTLALLVSACGKKAADSGPTCDQVVDHMLEVLKTGLTGHGNVEMGNRKQMVDQCVSRKLDAKQRTCMLNAKDLTALSNCNSAPPPSAPGSGG